MESAEGLARKIEDAISAQYRESPNERGGVMTVSKDYTDAAKLIEADRAAIRAECAERAIAYCELNRLTNGWHEELRAAIVE